jgi:histidyl-tRNA synthetase
LVRGLDYYTGFVFEAISSDLGAQDAYLGGGRYDNLCHQLGGKSLPAIGMAIGIERLASLVKTEESINNSINIDVQLSEASLKSKLRRANKDNAAYALIIGDEELKSETIIVKSLLEEVSEQTVMSFKDIESFIKEIK